MIERALLLIPGAGPFLAVGNLLATPAGRRAGILTVSVAASFWFGWHLKARIDESATLRAVIARQRIDLTAAQETAAGANIVISDIAQRDANNQEVIRDLQSRLSQHRSGNCTLDPAAADGLRRLR